MRIGPWLAAFRPLHQLARNGRLAGPQLEEYRKLRNEMTQTILAPLGQNHRPGQPARKLIRVAQAFQVDLDLPGGRQRLLTNSLSAGGFSGLVHHDPGKAAIGFSLRLPGGVAPVVGRAKPVGSLRRTGNYLVSFCFVDVAPDECERVELAIFDTVLKQIDSQG